MDPDLIERYLQEHLTTIEAVDRAAGAVGVSRSTMYRLKANPRHIELGQLMELTRAIGMPIDETFSWLPNDFLAEERHRLGHEAQAAEASGLRMTVTPFFTVLDGPRIAAPGGAGFAAGFQAIKPFFDEMFLGRRPVSETLAAAQHAANAAAQR